jgi:hypothetical protein
MPTGFLASLKAQFMRMPLVIVLTLAVLVSAQADVPRWQTAIEALSGYPIVNQTDTLDRYLNVIGFDQTLRDSIAQWHAQPAIIKVEQMYWFAEAGRKGSGQDALAMLSRAIAVDYPPLNTHSEVAKLYKATESMDAGRGVLQFRRPKLPALALPSQFQEVVRAFSSHVADVGHVTAELLLHKAGAKPSAIYKALRSSRSVREVLAFYLAGLKTDVEREQMVRRMADFIVEKFPSARENPHLKRFVTPDQDVADIGRGLKDGGHPPTTEPGGAQSKSNKADFRKQDPNRAESIKRKPDKPPTDKLELNKSPRVPLPGGGCVNQALKSLRSVESTH